MRIRSLLLAVCLCAWGADKNQLPTVETKVEPDWGSLTTGYIVDTVDVEVTVLPSGEPFSLNSITSLPDPAVRALAQWRFTKYRKDGRDMAFTTVVKIPIRHKPDSDYAGLQQAHFQASDELGRAIYEGSELDSKAAARLLAKLPDTEAPKHPRTSLLAYYADKGAADNVNVRQIRRDLLTWLIQNDPANSTLSSPSAIVNPTGEPLADSETASLLTQQWLHSLQQHPNENAVTANALNLLRVSNPAQALTVINRLPPSPQRSIWLGHVYALSALNISALSPKDGLAIASSSPRLSDSDTAAASARQALLTSTDVKTVLSGMAATIETAKSLTSHKALPEGYATYCQALLQHTRSLFPQTSQTCDIPQAPAQSLVNEVHEAVLKKKVQPRYPPLAKQQGIQGKVEFTAIIGADGFPHALELLHGPFAFYDESLKAISQWKWQPTLFNGVPTPVITNIMVSYTLEYR